MINNISESTSAQSLDPVIPAKSANFFAKLQKKWGVNSLFQVFLILLAFSLAGSSVVFLRKALFNFLEFNETTPLWVKTMTYIAFVFPSYQILILTYGSLLGQFNFFWEKEKKLGRAILKVFK